MVERESLSSWDRYRARSSIALLIRSVDSIRLLYTTLHATKSNLQQIIGARCPSYKRRKWIRKSGFTIVVASHSLDLFVRLISYRLKGWCAVRTLQTAPYKPHSSYKLSATTVNGRLNQRAIYT